jgi:hypothetical protein
MQDEELDKLINDAASQHHPPYDDKAWGKMERLLEKHLPQQKRSKKFIFWMLFFLLPGGAATLCILQPWKNTNPTTIAKNTDNKKSVTANTPGVAVPADNNAAVNNTTATNPLAKQKNGINNTTAADGTGGQKIIAGTKPVIADKDVQQTACNTRTTYRQKSRSYVKVKKPTISFDDGVDAAIQKTKPEKNNDADNNNSASDDTEKQNDIAQSPVNKLAGDKKEEVAAKTDSITAAKEKTNTEKNPAEQQKKKVDKSFAGKFAITVSAGADVSYVSINNAGKLKPFYGAGLRYRIAKHFTVASGLYVSKKIYSAAPSQYKFAAGYPNPNLVNINGECKIYEIPLTVYYNFKQVKNHNWFGAAGLSSYLMKKESYDYMYKNPAGQTWNYVKDVNNENKHYFSVLTLSGGYQYKLNNRLFFLAEPYIKLPVNNGVGLGKVKLNSAGLLFTAAVKPFAKRKK